MIAIRVTVTQIGIRTGPGVIARGILIVPSASGMTTAATLAAIEEGWMIYTGESVATTTAEISAASRETESEDRITTATGETVVTEIF